LTSVNSVLANVLDMIDWQSVLQVLVLRLEYLPLLERLALDGLLAAHIVLAFRWQSLVHPLLVLNLSLSQFSCGLHRVRVSLVPPKRRVLANGLALDLLLRTGVDGRKLMSFGLLNPAAFLFVGEVMRLNESAVLTIALQERLVRLLLVGLGG